MEPATISIVTTTVVQLAQLAVIAYGVGSTRILLIHWLDKRTEPLFPRRTAEEQQIDAARAAGTEPYNAH